MKNIIKNPNGLDLIKLSLMTKKNLLQWFFLINHLK